MKALGFGTPSDGGFDATGGKRVRLARFEARSSLPISAACVVANGIRETLSSLLGRSVALRLFEPTIPAPNAWPAIVRNARLYRVRGTAGDAALILRAPDAAALAAALFGESPGAAVPARALSPIECDVLDCMVKAIAANLGAVCGPREDHAVERVAALDGFVTYFELFVEDPVASRIGIALSREPSSEAHARLEPKHLAGVKLTTLASLDLGEVDAAAISRLVVGSLIPIDPTALHRCSLAAHGRKLARGGCGVRDGRYAFHSDAREST